MERNVKPISTNEKKMKQCTHLLFCGFVLLTNLFSQKNYAQSKPLNPTLEQITLPSPNAFAITKFANIPVGGSTGIPQVGVPVYSFQSPGSGLNMNISLDYHAGGIRVDEMSSNIGIGWALNAGGVISRSVRALYDEMDGIGYINSPALPASVSEGNTNPNPPDRPYNRMYDQSLDYQNDIFSYNFAGRSGKFVFGKNGNFLMLNQQKLIVEKEIGVVPPGTTAYPMISKFTLTDEFGLKYVFSAAEVTNTHAGTPAALHTSSWFLTKILNPAGKDSIVLGYEDVVTSYSVGKNASESLRHPGILIPDIPEKPYSVSVSTNTVYGKRIKNIMFPNGVVMDFIYSTTERTEQPSGDYLLKKIKISGGGLVKGYHLIQDYTLNRPTLKSVVPYEGISERTEAGYEFTYDAPLPARLDNGQDHWGFYNSNSSGSLIPSETISVGSGGTYGNYHVLGGGNRNTDTVKCKAGSLKKIKYPTGGYTDFEMEVNRAVDPRLDTRRNSVREIYTREEGVTVYCTSSSNTSTTFNFQGDTNSATEFTVTVPSVSYSCSGGCKVVMEIRNPSGLLIDVRYFDAPNSSSQPENKFTLNNLVPGIHTITSYTQGIYVSYFSYVSFRWKEKRFQNPIIVEQAVGELQLYVGGLRARKITDYGAASTVPSLVREFEYVEEDGITSSGTLGIYPVYTDQLFFDKRNVPYTMHVPEEYIPSSNNVIVRSSSTIFPLMYSNGAPVAYKRIIEKMTGTEGDNGKTVSWFSSFKEAPAVISKPYPYTPPEYKEWNNGLLDSVLYFNSSNVLTKKEVSIYQSYNDTYWHNPVIHESFRSISIAPVKYCVGSELSQPYVPYWVLPVYFKSESFYPIAGRSEIIGKITYDYDGHGNVLTTGVTYTYDQNNLYLKSVSTTNSSNEEVVTTYRYPKDLVAAGQDPGNIFYQMIGKNIINQVVEETRVVDNNQVSLVKRNYYSPFPGVFTPRSIDAAMPYPLETRVLFNLHNLSGNILEQQKNGDAKEVYFWGYNFQYPVAKIVGADYATASQFISQSILDNPPSDQDLRNELNKLRMNLPAASVVTYTYNPLTGITSETDPAGRTVYYEYDGFGRLKLTRDQLGAILKQYDYQYQISANH